VEIAVPAKSQYWTLFIIRMSYYDDLLVTGTVMIQVVVMVAFAGTILVVVIVGVLVTVVLYVCTPL
jgi:hypothetical protein